MRKWLILFGFLLCACIDTYSMNSIIPPGLEPFSSITVFSVIQDSEGAIWLSSSRGVYRYNGHTLEQIHTQLPWIKLTADERNVYVTSPQKVMKFDASTHEVTEYPGRNIMFTSSIPACDSTGFYLGVREMLFCLQDDGLQVCDTLPGGHAITAMEMLPGGRIVIGTAQGALFVRGADGIRKVSDIGSRIAALMPCSDGTVWAGFQDGMEQLDIATGETRQKIERCGNEALHNVRAFSYSSDSILFAGTPQGLYSLTPDGLFRKEELLGFQDRPICCLYEDRDGNLWSGTYYDGIRMSNPHAFPYETIPDSAEIQIVKGMADMSDGTVAIMTDGHGMWRLNPKTGKCTMVPGTNGIKFQNAFYDKEYDAVWAGDNLGVLYSISHNRIRKYTGPQLNDAILSVLRLGEDLLLGGRFGIFAFNPKSETTISRKLEGTVGNVYDMESNDGITAWIAGAGLYSYSPENGIRRHQFNIENGEWINNTPCDDIEFDMDGRLWLTFSRNGTVCLDNGGETHYIPENCGMLDNATRSIAALNDGSIAIATLGGISVLKDGVCHNYPAIIGSHLFKLKDGNMLSGGNDGVKMVKTAGLSFPGPIHDIVIDHFYVNGKHSNISTLKHTETSFSFDIASFDYTEVDVKSFYYRLDGYDKHWHRFDIHSPVSFMNMRPGRYTFRVQSRSLSGDILAEDDRSFRIKPVWYASWWAVIMEASVILAVAGTLQYNRKRRMKLSRELARKEKENRDKTLFFIDLSYSLRTPINLIIGKLERFFRDFGSRTAGIESIEDVYNKSIRLRTMISEYVDTQNGSLLKEAADSSTIKVLKDAKFLNAAIGAVERNLYSGKLDISTLCSELNIGKTSLTQRIEDVTGLTPRAFIEDIRLKHAAQMLSDGSHRVAEISDLLGFSSQNHFSQRFKIKYGVTPREYAKNNQSQSAQ